MLPFDVELVSPLPQRRTAQHSLDHGGKDVDITMLWLKTIQLLSYVEQLTVHINSQTEIISTQQELIEDLLERVVALENP